MAAYTVKNASGSNITFSALGDGSTTPHAPMQLLYPTPASTSNYATATNAAATITYSAGGSGVFHAIYGIAWSLGSTPASAVVLSITDNGNTVFAIGVTNSGPGFIPICIANASANTALVVSLAAAGTGIVGRVNVLSKWTFTN